MIISGPSGEVSESRGSGMGVHYVVGGGSGPRGEAGQQGPRGQPVRWDLFCFKNKLVKNMRFTQGQPGENGIPGKSYSEEDLRDICYNVLRSQLEELTANLQGPPGNNIVHYIIQYKYLTV